METPNPAIPIPPPVPKPQESTVPNISKREIRVPVILEGNKTPQNT
jgi:hypothetical protein